MPPASQCLMPCQPMPHPLPSDAPLFLQTLIHSSHNPEETVLLHIEQQAVVQMVLWKTAQSVADSNLRSSVS